MPAAKHGPSPGRGAMAKSGMAALTLGALGVVFGDIGTSPLYALQAVFNIDGRRVQVTPVDVYGVISLVIWSITMIVSVKYVTFIMRADNDGEGGIMALTALLEGARLKRRLKFTLVMAGIIGASLFYGDGAITPAISVLSAVQGLQIATPSLSSLVLPITIAVLVLLFAIQRFGTGLVGHLFGPVMAVWFSVLALIGAIEVAHHPSVLRALSPTYGAQFVLDHPGVAFVALGAVVLAVTGAEALYADMGHFGRGPIRRAWFLLVFPSLTLNYLAQGSLILREPKTAIANPFFLLVPGWAQIPLVILATVATVIASQAVISGAFSVTRQAMQLGFLPRLTIRQTSEHEVGQVYAPAVNMILFVVVVAIVLGFRSSNALASAYGVAVTGTFILNTTLFLAVARFLWHKPKRLIALGAVVFLSIEVPFFAANLTKVVHGGWLPLAIAVLVCTILTTWRKGREIVTHNRIREEGPVGKFVEYLGSKDCRATRVPGTAIFLNANPKTTPLALRANVEHNHVIHEQVIIICIDVERVPHIPRSERLAADKLGHPHDGITGIVARFGFQDDPDIPGTLRMAAKHDLLEGDVDLKHASYFLSQITIVPTRSGEMRMWRKKLFLFLAHNAANPATYFKLPDDRTVTMGERIEL